MILSASQLKTFLACPRQWWFSRVTELPTSPGITYGKVFGNVLHGVIERWLLADEQGRDPSGAAVDLYPLGWEWDWETKTRLEPGDDERIKELLNLAIEQGDLARRPGRRIEMPDTLTLATGGGVGESSRVVRGYIDECYPEQGIIWDHKGVKVPRYIPSAKQLAQDPQLLLYAGALYMMGYQHEEYHVGHRSYIRTGKPKVKSQSVVVTKHEVLNFFEEVVANSELMQDVEDSGLHEHQWSGVTGAMESDEKKEACGAFGGCPYLRVCAKEKSTKEHRELVAKARLAVLEPERAQEASVDLLESLRKNKVKATLDELAQESPPCPSLSPDPINSSDWQEPSEPEPASVGAQLASPGPSAESPPATSESSSDPSSAPSETPAPSKSTSPSPESTEVPVQDSRPTRAELQKLKKGELVELAFNQAIDLQILASSTQPEAPEPTSGEVETNRVLLVNALAAGSDKEQVGTLADLLVRYVESQGDTMETFFAANGFARRDQIYRDAEKIVNLLPNDVLVIAQAKTPDERQIQAAIEPFMDTIIYGIS